MDLEIKFKTREYYVDVRICVKTEGGSRPELRLLLHGSVGLRSASLTKALPAAFHDYPLSFHTNQNITDSTSGTRLHLLFSSQRQFLRSKYSYNKHQEN